MYVLEKAGSRITEAVIIADLLLYGFVCVAFPHEENVQR